MHTNLLLEFFCVNYLDVVKSMLECSQGIRRKLIFFFRNGNSCPLKYGWLHTYVFFQTLFQQPNCFMQ
jgi:hypothetical protein